MKESLLYYLKSKIWGKEYSTKSRFNSFLEIAIIILFGLSFFSIPTFSFIGAGRFVTWFFVIILVVAIALDLFLFYEVKIDFVGLCFLFFAFSAFLSSLFCLFKAFKFTPILLSLLAFIIYCFCSSTRNKFNSRSLLFASSVGVALFLFFFIFRYRNELFHLNFSRLGSLFGDDNDVALFMGFGLISSLSFGLNFSRKTLIINLLFLVLSPLYLLAGLSTGSKIFIIIVILCLFFFPFYKFGRKRWYFSILIISCTIGLFFILINMPFLSTIKERFNSFISTLLGKSVSDGKTNELSTINRLDMFMCGMQMWLRKPIFGWGIWGFATFSGRAGGWSHNNISESFCNFGLIGTIFFHFGFFTSFRGFTKSWQKKDKYLSFILLLFFVVSMISVALNSQKLYAMLIGVVFCDLSDAREIISFAPSNLIKRLIKRKECLNESN